MKRTALLLSLLFSLTALPVSAQPASPQNWYYVGQSPRDEQIFINNSAVIKNADHAVIAVKTNPSSTGRRMFSSCQYDITIYTLTRDYQYSVDGVYLYNADHQLLSKLDKGSGPRPVPADSMLRKIYAIIWHA